jgi:hypothetical protein
VPWLASVLVIGVSICALAQSKNRSTASAPRKTDCSYIGQFYNASDQRGKVWVGFRLCNLKAASHFLLNVSSGTWRTSFPLPFSSSTDAGSTWQRLSREKTGCDLVLVKTGVTRKALGFSWSVTPTAMSGKVTFSNLLWRPFSLPASRFVKRPKPVRSLKSAHTLQKAPPKP